MSAALLALPLLLLAEGPPLFYWGSRPAAIAVEGAPSGGVEAQVQEVHAALDKGALVVRFTFDRSVREATRLPDGAPVSGRLRATLLIDRDADRATGLDQGPADLRTGADLRLEVGVLAVGEDAEEHRPAIAVVTVTLVSLSHEGRRQTLWRADDSEGGSRQVRTSGEWLEIRLPAESGVLPKARLILSLGDRALEGRLP